MARGSESKEKITAKILETFEGSFKFDKEIRIPMQENGELIQIKVTLTAAKQNVDMGGDTTVPSAKTSDGDFPVLSSSEDIPIAEPTAEEKANVERLISQIF